MCVILYKPKGVELPGTKTLSNCWKANPHGAGIMYPTPEGVYVDKGFMSFDALCRALDSLGDVKDLPLVIHFRIASHGGVSAELTHPFPVTDKTEVLGARRSVCRTAIAHNGIIQLTSEPTDEFSDTWRFIRDYASAIIRGPRYYRDAKTVDALEYLVGGFNKLAILSRDGHVELVGKFEQYEDCFFSNDSFRPVQYCYGATTDDLEWPPAEDVSIFGFDDPRAWEVTR